MNWKKIWFGILVIGIPLVMLGATIRWYNDAGIPQKTAIVGTEIMSLQQTSPNAYRWALLSDVKTYMGTSNEVQNSTNYVLYSSNYYAGDSYVTEYFTTNIYPNYNASNYLTYHVYVTNQMQTNVTFEQYLSADGAISNYIITQIFQDNSVSNYIYTNVFPTTENYYTNTIGGDFIANLNGTGTNTALYGQTRLPSIGPDTLVKLDWFNRFETIPNSAGVLSNDGSGIIQWVPVQTLISNTTLNIQKLTVNSNITYQTATPFTNVWASGPTGTLDLALSDQNYTASADMALTGVINKSNTVVQNVMLTIVASGANRTLFLTGEFAESTGATSYVCTNGVPREIWVRYTPAFGGRTNCCSLSFFRP